MLGSCITQQALAPGFSGRVSVNQAVETDPDRLGSLPLSCKIGMINRAPCLVGMISRAPCSVHSLTKAQLLLRTAA